ncbi:MAG: thioredoxin domain-containing protein [Steroidobacteraceae bacterium]
MSNRLRGSLSPYLLQHADDPVHWYPWGPEAFAEAVRTGKPVLLSIGYSSCHWCHVMARESFADPATAAAINERFVSIKVDREERPDIDRVYQLAHQLITRRVGGWPLTMFLSADRIPFFGGTYFPAAERAGLPAFTDLMGRIAAFHREQQAAMHVQNEALLTALARVDAPHPLPAPLQPGTAQQAVDAVRADLEQRFDAEHGGFGAPPKFPMPAALTRLLRHWQRTASSETPDLKALYLATLTLHRMAEGGLMDQLGGGFARYSTDAAWHVPHFEKMLYDNATLLELYAEAHSATGEPLYAEVAARTADFLLRDLRHRGGAFHGSLDADSDEGEGRFYLWTPDEVIAVLGAEDGALFNARHGLDGPANVDGRWHLRIARPLEELGDAAVIGPRLDALRKRLLEVRSGRTPPARDDKILAGWNALAIRALVVASRALKRPELLDAAAEALHFLRRELWRDGQLAGSWLEGRLGPSAFLDDHAYLADATIELLAARFDPVLLQFALDLAERLRTGFAAPTGGFHFTATDQEPLIHRTLRFDDDATPAGNAIAARVLLRLGHLTGRTELLDEAERTLLAAGTAPLEQPLGHLTLVESLDEWLHPASPTLRALLASLERASQRENQGPVS